MIREHEQGNFACTRIGNKRYSLPCASVIIVIMSIASVSTIYYVESAYGQEDTAQNNTDVMSDGPDSMTDTYVSFKSNLEQIVGHLNAAMLNKESGNDTLALAHAFHPVVEVYTIIGSTIANANSTLNDTLSVELSKIPDTVASSAPEFSMAIQNAKQLLNLTSDTVIPSELKDNLTFNTMVVIDLLAVAENEYEEAVANNTIAEIVEYQDAQAFISRGIDRAESIFEQASNEIPENMSESVQDVKNMFSDLEQSILSISSPESVGSTIQGIIHELSEIAGIEDTSVAGESPDELISNIRELLNQVVTEYTSQNYDQAEAIAIEAYLENYEFIEAPLAEKNETLMETTEVMLREELRQLIQDQVTLEEIEEQIAKINANLDEAQVLLDQ